MGRENKFRGRRKNGEWMYGSLVISSEGDTHIIDHKSWHKWQVDPKTVGQFIGLTDKNGREVYSHDLVEDENGIGEVEWVQEHCAYLVFTRNPSQYHRLESDGQLSQTVVVGNAIDNPELIEV
ncbi:putative phage protein (TIGR01671 family) [Paenibacillus sp. PastF-3]|uniref:YopX family protein n=1 Tax=unclassified Paenibacillus TaxID=185978 RepID=UPI0004F7436E|nr:MULTISPECIES: YopX family protein [unclassified Paenibacillus]AIQ34216.1 hypothetical protein R50345_06000 [Paenibacillus sp. FSL R5-0345]MDH6373555.1 putative phage protein (TIGR01671 family) [Paenibacillus sp. PastF-3]